MPSSREDAVYRTLTHVSTKNVRVFSDRFGFSVHIPKGLADRLGSDLLFDRYSIVIDRWSAREIIVGVAFDFEGNVERGFHTRITSASILRVYMAV
jgi:hypothetical protein